MLETCKEINRTLATGTLSRDVFPHGPKIESGYFCVPCTPGGAPVGTTHGDSTGSPPVSHNQWVNDEETYAKATPPFPHVTSSFIIEQPVGWGLTCPCIGTVSSGWIDHLVAGYI